MFRKVFLTIFEMYVRDINYKLANTEYSLRLIDLEKFVLFQNLKRKHFRDNSQNKREVTANCKLKARILKFSTFQFT